MIDRSRRIYELVNNVSLTECTSSENSMFVMPLILSNQASTIQICPLQGEESRHQKRSDDSHLM